MIGLCRLSPLLLEPDRPQKTMVCSHLFPQFSKGVHPDCVQAISLRHLHCTTTGSLTSTVFGGRQELLLHAW